MNYKTWTKAIVELLIMKSKDIDKYIVGLASWVSIVVIKSCICIAFNFLFCFIIHYFFKVN